MKEIKSTLDVSTSIVPLLRTASVNGNAIDLANYGGNAVLFTPGAITDGTHTPKLQESDVSGSGYTDVAAADQVGTLAALVANTNQKVSYIGGKRYIRAVITTTGSPATGGTIGAHAILSGKRKQP